MRYTVTQTVFVVVEAPNAAVAREVGTRALNNRLPNSQERMLVSRSTPAIRVEKAD